MRESLCERRLLRAGAGADAISRVDVDTGMGVGGAGGTGTGYHAVQLREWMQRRRQIKWTRRRHRGNFLDKGGGMIHDVEIGGGHYNIENKKCNIQSNNI